ncbi:MAG TPA: N-acetylmuramoyl-L-alanine amidase [Chitinophagaceae bacterium]|nr:N-acetylmuramoyl-L-alanine amidase [Chitinophagaceae bacterium]
MKRFTWLIVISLVCACSRNPYAVTNKEHKKKLKQAAKTLRQYPQPVWKLDSVKAPDHFVGTINFNLRKPNYVIIHHTAQDSCSQTLRTFTLTRTSVSSHYVICKDGTLHHMLNDYLRAWHGGISKWGTLTDLNSASIGIELDNNGFQPFSEPQITSLMVLLDTLKRKYDIPAANFIGHADIAPTRKNDPNVYFPWKQLADRGFGLWYDDTTGVTVPDNFNHIQALRIVGYDTRDSVAAIRAFKRHFVQDTTRPVRMNEADRKILYNLSKKY